MAGLVAAGALAALIAGLVDKGSAPRYRTPGVRVTAAPEESRRPRPHAVALGAPTVYDAQDDLGRCVRSRPALGPADDLATISERVERLRRLEFERRVDTRLVPRAEVGERFVRRYLRGYGPRAAARDAQVLAALRLVPEGTDLRAATAELLAGGVAGFYHPRAERLFAGSASTTPTAYEEMVLAHELGHALVDQVLGFPRTEARDPRRADEMLAHQVLVEGDATLVMSNYAARRFTPDAYDAFAARFTRRAVVPGAVPYLVQRTSELAYYEGLLFVCREWLRAGWEGVDRLHRRPPATTAEVLFPARPPVDPRTPPAPRPPGRAWKRVPPRAFGAFDVMLLLENADLLSGGETVPGRHIDAVRGWAGGTLSAWLRGDETTIHLALVDAGVETPGGRRRRLCAAITGWVLETFPGARRAPTQLPGTRAWRTERELAVLRCDGGSIELVKGPERGTVWRLLFS